MFCCSKQLLIFVSIFDQRIPQPQRIRRDQKWLEIITPLASQPDVDRLASLVKSIDDDLLLKMCPDLFANTKKNENVGRVREVCGGEEKKVD